MVELLSGIDGEAEVYFSGLGPHLPCVPFWGGGAAAGLESFPGVEGATEGRSGWVRLSGRHEVKLCPPRRNICFSILYHHSSSFYLSLVFLMLGVPLSVTAFSSLLVHVPLYCGLKLST